MWPLLGDDAAHPGARLDLVAVLVEHDGGLVDRDARAAGVRLTLGHDAGAAEAGLRGADRVGDDAVGQQFEELLLDAGGEQRGGAGEQEQRRQVVRRCPASWCASSASSSGRAIASPVKNSRFTLCSWIIRQTSSASNSGASTTVWPENSDIQVADWVAPWIIGGIGQPDHRRVLRGRLGEVVLVLDGLARREVGAAEQHSVDVLVAPHHALGEAGGAAGVEQVDVVGAALAEVALRRALLQRGVELDAAVALVVVIAAVLDHQDGLDVRRLGQHVGHPVGVAALVHERDHVGVVEQVLQLALDVAEVDVDQDRAGLDDAEHRDDDLDAVRQ